MTIHTRWGGECKILAKHGLHTPRYLVKDCKYTLVSVQHPDEKHTRYAWAEFMKAEGGWAEILAAMQDVPQVELNPVQLKVAFGEAR